MTDNSEESNQQENGESNRNPIEWLLDRIRLIFLSLFQTVIAIPYFLVFLLRQALRNQGLLLRVVFWGVIILLVLWVLRSCLPFEWSTWISILVSFGILALIAGIGYLLVKKLSGLWRLLAAAIILLVLFILFNFLRLDKPRSIPGAPQTLDAPIAAIEMQVEEAPPGEREKLRKRLEAQWDIWHQQYYQTSQGNQIFPLDWFQTLEQRSTFGMIRNTTPFASPENLTRYRVIPGNRSRWNPEGMPIGSPKDIDKWTGQSWMSISCASCHTSQLSYKGEHLLIDGAPTLQDFTYTEDMINALIATRFLPSKFDRFAANTLGDDRDNDAQRRSLKKEVGKYLGQQEYGFIAQFGGAYPTVEGFGRVDALGRGANGQFAPLSVENIAVSSGPVSFPPVWYTHEFDWVQSVSAIQQPLGRNMTEAWGVNARIYAEDWRRFQTTLKPENLFWVETYLSLIEPPKWPGEILGEIDRKKVERGRFLYEEMEWPGAANLREMTKAELFEPAEDLYEVVPEWNDSPGKKGLCAHCHRPRWARLTDYGINQWFEEYRDDFDVDAFKESEEGKALIAEFKTKRFNKLRMYGFDILGTSSVDAVNFNARQSSFFQINLGGTGTTQPPGVSDYFGKEQAGVAEALQKFTSAAKRTVYNNAVELFQDPADAPADNKLPLPERAVWDGFRPNLFRAPMGYPARPMRGYWATAPFLHNGSIPDLYQLLSPWEERDKTFYVGNIEFDPEKVGYRSKWFRGAFKFDTSEEGNANTGHEFADVEEGESSRGVIGPYLSPEDRLAIIEYMKVIKDVDYYPDEDTGWRDYRKEENARRWSILQSMWFNEATGRFQLRQGYGDYRKGGDKYGAAGSPRN